ncbi:MAG: hypothetical protein WCG81_11100 [Candidatus Angelobacter sp.]
MASSASAKWATISATDPFVRGGPAHQLLTGLAFQQCRKLSGGGLLQTQRVFAIAIT